ncbi:MAG: hypothetical protein Q8N76_05185 [Candidatus Omnitrophota bacterium]|nr:hypothetical protein [Candidatus Omnitrophota bacterium]
MKKILTLAVCVIFLFSGLAYAEQKSSQSNAASVSAPGGPMPGMMVGTGMAQNIMPVLNEAISVLKELIKRADGSKFSEENQDLIQRAKDAIKKSEDAVKVFPGVSNPASKIN